jgi:hypothetical protein
MPFSNPILGGTALVRPAINSPDYVAGTSGWTINQDGSAEFNDVTVRGELDVVDANPTQEVIVARLTGDIGPRIEILADGSIRWANGTAVVAARFYYASGTGLTVSPLHADNPATHTPEVWTAFPFANGWTNHLSGYRHFMYLRLPFNAVWLLGTIESPNPFNATIGTMPTGYRPVDTQPIGTNDNNLSAPIHLEIDLNGVVTAVGDTTVNRTWWVNGIYTLDN